MSTDLEKYRTIHFEFKNKLKNKIMELEKQVCQWQLAIQLEKLGLVQSGNYFWLTNLSVYKCLEFMYFETQS